MLPVQKTTKTQSNNIIWDEHILLAQKPISTTRGDHIKCEKIVNASTCMEITGNP